MTIDTEVTDPTEVNPQITDMEDGPDAEGDEEEDDEDETEPETTED
ncbi:MAG: hypothetical protein JO103_06155 [Candidatus Eremiobacteraeota bacterium]|nr:hypothetical protein [Candidatus Eremiobacteraeota bacterium]